jgi:DNA-binding NarL/FixJ family response regulator
MKPLSKRVTASETLNVPAGAVPLLVPSRPIIRVAIVEDDEWLRTSLVTEISNTTGFQCLGAFRSAELALKNIPTLNPDVVLMDINLPGMDGVQCVRQLKEVCPKVQFLMLTVYEESDRIFNSLQAGARGYLLKRTAKEELFEAIRQVMAGGTPLTDHIARKIVHYFNQQGARASTLESLSPRETKVLEVLALGLSYKEVADSLTLSIDTIRMNVRHIYHKLHVHSRAEAVAKYLSAR